jgi:hydroxymethylbilane synthase
MTRLRIGSRGSRLARWQAEYVASLLRACHADLDVEIVILTTTGDRILDAPLAKIGGKGLFTKEIEEALLDGRIDVAVHSLKDLPTALPEGLALGAVLERHDPSDALVSPAGTRFRDLPRGARIGTSSLRRAAQLLHARPDLKIIALRGNVPTRVEKASTEGLDAIVLARAGLERLDLGARITEVLPFDLLLPAPGQGAVAIEVRAGDAVVVERIEPLEDRGTRAATDAERGFLQALGGGCQVPIGALALPEPDGRLSLEGMVAEPSGKTLLRSGRSGRETEAAALGAAVAADLVARGAGGILEALGPGIADGEGA